ncbi:uncharacterized protein LOC142574082 [Dermacentor variabilis]|uniref:uncharacterized protein LOC142574082 n=1 Tax=Dermacentor variabilis TaxID=34621 RepID=UPI003F5B545B
MAEAGVCLLKGSPLRVVRVRVVRVRPAMWAARARADVPHGFPSLWLLSTGRFDASNLQRIASSGRCGVSVWGSVSKEVLGPIVRLVGRLPAAACKDLLGTVL